MELKIGQVAKMTGLSSSGIRFLEDEGIIVPSNGRVGKYRSYDVSNVSNLLDFRNYRECGFSLDEAANMIKECEIDDACYAFNRECDSLVREIMDKQRLVVFLRKREKATLAIKNRRNLLEIVTRPSLLYLRRDLSIHEEDWPAELGFEIPYADSSIYIAELNESNKIINAQWSVAMEADDAFGYDFLNDERVGFMKSHKALHTIIEVNDDLSIDNKQLEEVYKYLKDNNYLYRHAVTKRIVSIKENGIKKRFDHLWIDID